MAVAVLATAERVHSHAVVRVTDSHLLRTGRFGRRPARCATPRRSCGSRVITSSGFGGTRSGGLLPGGCAGHGCSPPARARRDQDGVRLLPGGGAGHRCSPPAARAGRGRVSGYSQAVVRVTSGHLLRVWRSVCGGGPGYSQAVVRVTFGHLRCDVAFGWRWISGLLPSGGSGHDQSPPARRRSRLADSSRLLPGGCASHGQSPPTRLVGNGGRFLLPGGGPVHSAHLRKVGANRKSSTSHSQAVVRVTISHLPGIPARCVRPAVLLLPSGRAGHGAHLQFLPGTGDIPARNLAEPATATPRQLYASRSVTSRLVCRILGPLQVAVRGAVPTSGKSQRAAGLARPW